MIASGSTDMSKIIIPKSQYMIKKRDKNWNRKPLK